MNAKVIERLFARFDQAVREQGFSPMSGQIVDASLVAAPRQHNTEAEKAEIKEGRIPQDWKDKPAKLTQKDRDACWTVKYTKASNGLDASNRQTQGCHSPENEHFNANRVSMHRRH